jgi:AcrR family transcriptional regulator
MALYKHVANKEELLDGMVDVIVGEIDPPVRDADWKTAVRERILSARRALLRHPWAPRAIESRANPAPVVLDYLNSTIGLFRTGGLSADLTHRVMHALGSRVFGFSQEVYPPAPGAAAAPPPDALRAMAERYPYVAEIATAAAHDTDSVVGGGCDDQFEFEFALDIMLDVIERLHGRGWTPAG